MRYYSGTLNITTAMRSATGYRATLAPGAHRLIKVQITVLREAVIGSFKPATVTAAWTGDSTRTDAVKQVVKVVR